MKRTHAIRTQLETDARNIVHVIAQNLTNIKPWQPAHNNTRTKGPDLIAARLHGHNLYADEVAHRARNLMPAITRNLTRGEYALILRRAAGKVDA